MSKPIPVNPMSTDQMTAEAAVHEGVLEREAAELGVAGSGNPSGGNLDATGRSNPNAPGHQDHLSNHLATGPTTSQAGGHRAEARAEGSGPIAAVKRFKADHPTAYEFIMFNILSNVATITNFVVLWLGTGWLFTGLSDRPFDWFIFHYPVKAGGLGGFISFLLAYVCAQIVNFIVQRKLVFSATVKIAKVIPWYILTVVVAGIISIWLPPIIIDLLKPYVGGFAATLANVVNIFLQVVINWPMMKFVIMRKE